MTSTATRRSGKPNLDELADDLAGSFIGGGRLRQRDTSATTEQASEVSVQPLTVVQDDVESPVSPGPTRDSASAVTAPARKPRSAGSARTSRQESVQAPDREWDDLEKLLVRRRTRGSVKDRLALRLPAATWAAWDAWQDAYRVRCGRDPLVWRMMDAAISRFDAQLASALNREEWDEDGNVLRGVDVSQEMALQFERLLDAQPRSVRVTKSQLGDAVISRFMSDTMSYVQSED